MVVSPTIVLIALSTLAGAGGAGIRDHLCRCFACLEKNSKICGTEAGIIDM
jgi:hypothetical protein